MKDLISIVVPAYNHEKYIDRCIDSIISQTYENIELIIVNDGSPDETARRITERVKECEERFTRFVFIDKENEGQIKTFNRGCEEARGEYLAICASDDAYVPEAIETLQNFLCENPDYVLAVGDNYFMDEKGVNCFWDGYQKNVYSEQEASYFSFADFLKKVRADINILSKQFGTYSSFLKGNYVPNGYLFNRDVFMSKIGGYAEEASLEDYYLHLQLSKYGKYKYLDEKLFYYRWHGGNTILQRDKMIRATRDTFLLEKDYCYNNGLQAVFDKANPEREWQFKIPFLFSIQKKYSVEGKSKLVQILGFKVYEKFKANY